MVFFWRALCRCAGLRAPLVTRATAVVTAGDVNGDTDGNLDDGADNGSADSSGQDDTGACLLYHSPSPPN